MNILKKKKRPGRPKGSLNKPKPETLETIVDKKQLSPEMKELLTKKIDLLTDKIAEDLNRQNILVSENLDYKYLLRLIKLVDVNPDIEITITTKDNAVISIRNKPEDYKNESYESLLESLPEDPRGNIFIK